MEYFQIISRERFIVFVRRLSVKQNKNEKSVNKINNRPIDLRNDINRKEILENENSKKVVHIVKKNIDFNK